MKITPADFAQLKIDIATAAKALGVNIAAADGGKTGLLTMHGLHTVVDRNRAYDDAHPGFAGGAWKRVLPFTGRDYCHLYNAGLNDSHIATALHRIKAELTVG
jgi:hypothetical protein